MLNQAKKILKQTFGFDSFRPLQEDVIKNILYKKDTMVIMPTGGGKSLCYQIPALIFQGSTLVISPLISLMKDQVEQLTELGVDAVVLNSSLAAQEYNQNVEKVRQKKAKLLYLAPEALFTPRMVSLLSSIKIDCIAIDEAHCISEWGHDFRPEYRKIIEIRKRFPKAVCVALTATATPRVQEDIRSNLYFKAPNQFIASFNRENLFLQVVAKENPIMQTIDFLKQYPNQSGIIYCFSRNQVDELSEILANEGFSVKPYHAGLTDADRKRNQELFIKDDVQIIVATIAFGMGINKPNVRFVIHYDLPKNIESYYQEIGRSGRDGLDAHCLLLFGYGDIQKIKYFIDQKEDQERQIANIHLSALVRYAETNVCRRIPLLNYFGEDYSIKNCSTCDNCKAGKKDLVDITSPAQMFFSCIIRTGEIFGAHHIIDVLRGSESQKVLKFGHQKLSTYGIGKEYSKKQWLYFSRQFIQQELVEQDLNVGSLKVCEKASPVLLGEENVFGLIQKEKVEYSYSKESKLEYDRNLFELLRKKRKDIADNSGLPPYVIFPDKTLLEMAFYFPQSSEGLLQIHGVGSAKMNKFGAAFLNLIKKFCRDHNIEEKPKKQWRDSSSVQKSTKKPRHIEIGDMFNSGISFMQIIKTYKVKAFTVLEHLYKFIQEGHSLNRPDEFKALSSLTPQLHTEVILNFTKHGTEYLKPVFEALNRKVPYNELRILRLYFLSRK